MPRRAGSRIAPQDPGELTGGTRADVTFECAGLNAVIDTVLDAVRPRGVGVNMSFWGVPATVDTQKLVPKEIDQRGAIAYVGATPRSSR